jgi:hypothetical protein
MSCLGNKYNPIPPRKWTRYHNICSQPDAPNISIEEQLRLEMIRKGNVLQHKNNSSRWTKWQKHWYLSQRSFTSWASQTQTVSNPNPDLLKRVNSKYIVSPISSNIIDINTVTSIQNINCIKDKIPIINNLPDIGNDGEKQPDVPPPPPPDIENNTNNILPIVDTDGTTMYVIEDGGTLICNKRVDPCTGQLLQEFRNRDCYPTTCSDVPGRIQELCWSGRVPTYFPKVKRTYGTSNNKWPINAKFIRAATPNSLQKILYLNNSVNNLNSQNNSNNSNSSGGSIGPVATLEKNVNTIINNMKALENKFSSLEKNQDDYNNIIEYILNE